MKKIYLIVTVICIFLLASCTQDKVEPNMCAYDSGNIIDSSLYLSVNKNGVISKYYQILDKVGQSIQYFKLNDSIALQRIAFTIPFDDSIKNGIQTVSDISFFLTFYCTKIYNLKRKLENEYNVFLFDSLPSRLKFVIGQISEIKDTANLVGVSLLYHTPYSEGYSELSTDILYDNFENKDSLNAYLLNSYFQVITNEKVCDNYRLIKGTFSTKVMGRYSIKPSTIDFENVSFKFVLK